MPPIDLPWIYGKKLPYKQVLFLQHYFTDADQNATKAARLAGYRGNDQTLKALGWQILNKPKVREIIREWAAKNITADQVIERLSEQASGTMEDFLSWDDKDKPGDQQGDAYFDLRKARDLGKLHLVKKLEIGEKGIKIELYDAQVALVNLGRYFGLYTDASQLSIQVERLLRVIPDEFRERVRTALTEGNDPLAIRGDVIEGEIYSQEAGQAQE